MKIETRCSQCKTVLYSKTRYATKTDHKRYKGDYLILQCSNCGLEKQYPIKKFQVNERKSVKLFGLIFWLVATFIVGYVSLNLVSKVNNSYAIYALLAPTIFPTIIYTWVLKSERDRARSFNNS